jgi:hypothetical protein
MAMMAGTPIGNLDDFRAALNGPRGISVLRGHPLHGRKQRRPSRSPVCPQSSEVPDRLIAPILENENETVATGQRVEVKPALKMST